MNPKRKRNYKAERHAAAEYADKAMHGRELPTDQWTAQWGAFYEGFLVGYRTALNRSAAL